MNALHRGALAASSMGRVVGMHGGDVSFGMSARGCGAFLSERTLASRSGRNYSAKRQVEMRRPRSSLVSISDDHDDKVEDGLYVE